MKKQIFKVQMAKLVRGVLIFALAALGVWGMYLRFKCPGNTETQTLFKMFGQYEECNQ